MKNKSADQKINEANDGDNNGNFNLITIVTVQQETITNKYNNINNNKTDKNTVNNNDKNNNKSDNGRVSVN